VTVTVNVAANAGTPLAAQSSLSGGGSPATTATDNTVITPTPVLSVSESHTGSFTQGQAGATYTITASNGATAGPTAGTVTVTETLPSGLTMVSMSGTGWSRIGATCTRIDALGAGVSYPPVTVTVNVAANAGTPLAAQVSLSGGGSPSHGHGQHRDYANVGAKRFRKPPRQLHARAGGGNLHHNRQ
jgi:uncharacterized repeat protein (TIGR01451 family)